MTIETQGLGSVVRTLTDGGGGGGPPSGAAGGNLSGTYPNPLVTEIRESGGADLSIGAVADGEVVVRSGAAIGGQGKTALVLEGLSGANAAVDVNAQPIIDTSRVDYTTGLAVPAFQEGRSFFDNTNHTMGFYPDADVVLHFARGSWIRVRNSTVATITKGSVVYISGVHASGVPEISLAQANAEATSNTIGIVEADIAQNAIGYVCTGGSTHNLNTNGLTPNTALYLSADTPGGYTVSEPASPNLSVIIGYIIRAHITQGTILVVPARGPVTYRRLPTGTSANTVAIGNHTHATYASIVGAPTTNGIARLTAGGDLANSTVTIDNSGNIASVNGLTSGALNLTGVGGSSSLTSTSADLTISTATSGNLALTSAGTVTITAASTVSIGATTTTDVTLGRTGQTVTTNGFVRAVNGAPATAAYGFQNSIATGMRLASTGVPHQLALQCEGTDIQVMSTLDVTFGVRLMVATNGNATAPAYTWSGANGNNGFYLSGASQVGLTLGGNQTVNFSRSSTTFTQIATTSGVPTGWTFTTAANTGITTSQESPGFHLSFAATQTWTGSSTITTQRAARITAPTYAAAGATTFTTAATFAISGAPTAGANVTITNNYAFWVQAGRSQFDGAFATGSSSTVGFFGVTAVARQTVGAAATDAATTQTLANNLRTALINLGLCQT